MRRNMNRRGNGNMGQSGGPLMTEHLKDIDMELELLKRKRDMIEQQQHLLAMEQQYQTTRHYDYQPGSNRDFAYMYDNEPKHRNQFGRKRAAEPQWQYENLAKRTPPKRKGNQPPFNPRPGYVQGHAGPDNFRNLRPMQGPSQVPKGPSPLMSVKVKQSIGQKLMNQRLAPKPPRRPQPMPAARVTKPKPTSAPNTLASQPLAERKKLVAAAESASEVDVTRMLLPDQVPTQQVSGRLELALGAVMKDIRELIDHDSPHATMLRSVQIQRVMKQAIRERIKTVMLGKVVGSLVEILAIYREEFPKETDIDIVNIALEALGVPSAEREEQRFIESENPEEFYKQNMSCLIESKLTEMFQKLEEIYNGTPAEDKVNVTIAKKEEPTDEQESIEFTKFLDTNMQARDIKRVLPRLMKRYIPYIIKLLNLDDMYQSTKAALSQKTIQKASIILNRKDAAKKLGITDKAAENPAHGTSQSYTLPYYVKIMGRPSLPKKKLMQTFLSQFNPKSIKKHRTIHNLLFVGFLEKSDFDSIVSADGTVIGRITLSIRVCAKGTRESGPMPNGMNKEIDFSSDEVVTASNDETKSDSDLITSDLDCQITDLLTSIRKAEEEIDTQADIKTEPLAEKRAEQDALNDEAMKESNDATDNANQDTNDNRVDKNETEKTADENIGDNNSVTEKQTPDAKPEVTESEQSNINTSKATDTKDAEIKDTQDKLEETKESESKTSTETAPDSKSEQTEEGEKTTTAKTEEQLENDKVEELKNSVSGRATPTRASSRLASVTPSTIRTRRASRLTQN